MEDTKTEQRVDTHVIDDMIEKGVGVGTKIEITLSKDAAFYDGSTPAPTINPMGYEKFDDKYLDQSDKRPGLTVRGFVWKFDEVNGRVTVVNMWPVPGKGWADDAVYRFVESDVIASYIAEIPKTKAPK